MPRLKSLLLFLCSLVLLACSDPLGEDVGEVEQAVVTPCSITGATGSAAFNTTVITGVKIAPNYFGSHLIVTACDVAGSFCSSDTHVFADVHWTDVNGTAWAGSKDFPLRRIVTAAPGCQLSQPSKWCMTLYGDADVGDHVNLLQNGNRFLSDRPITIGAIEAPVGGAVTQFAGMGTSPINTWRTKYTNAAGTANATQNWTFTTPGCP